MNVTVLEILKKDVVDNESGKWFYVLLTSPMWVDNEDMDRKVSEIFNLSSG
ncbi:hypothetical protein [Treponema sp.]|uniref:hypothetical protein n=1 Tax=Treponema sp. TaxID=166 RepID=UPI00257DF494|nr:hypothetical protein [Treponema sp.]